MLDEFSDYKGMFELQYKVDIEIILWVDLITIEKIEN